MYSFELAKNGKGSYTGATKIVQKRADAVITALEQDVIQQVTVLVYLDGSVVNNSMVAANSAQSMSGKLNLQFASSAVLIPADNTALRGGESTPDTTPDKDPDQTPSNPIVIPTPAPDSADSADPDEPAADITAPPMADVPETGEIMLYHALVFISGMTLLVLALTGKRSKGKREMQA